MALDTPFIRGADRLRQRIETIRATLSVPVVVEDVSTLLEARTLRRFNRQVDPDEKPWPKLTEAGAASKRRSGSGGAKLLVRSGALRGSIRRIRGGSGTLSVNTGASARIGIDDPEIAEYARVHQEGLGRLPIRRFLGIGRLDVKAVDSYLRRRADALGL